MSFSNWYCYTSLKNQTGIKAIYHISRITYSIISAIFVILPVAFYAPVALAVPPDINGTYSGKITGDEDCPPLGNFPSTEDDIISAGLTFTVSQNGNSFTGSGSGIDDDDGETVTYQFSGTIDDAGNISANIDIQADVPQSGLFSGSFSNGTLNLFFDFSDNGPPNCHIFANGTFTRTTGGGIVVNPVVTPSSTLTAPILLNTQVKSISGDLNTRIGDVLRGIGIGPRQTATGFMWEGHSSGLNAGDSTMGYGAWGSYSYSDFENDFVSTAFDGHRHGFLAGLDIMPWENSVLGIAVGYEGSDIDTGFNRGNQETDGFTIAPYFGYLLTEHMSLDASLGYSRISSDQFRTDPGTGARITSSPDADRWFGAFNLNGFTTWDNWLFLARIGILHARNTIENFVESNGNLVAESRTRLGQISIGGEAAYSYDAFEPFARLSYEHDYSFNEITVLGGGRQPSNDNDNYLIGAGLRYFGTNGLTANLEWNKRLGREDYNEDTITATVRWEF